MTLGCTRPCDGSLLYPRMVLQGKLRWEKFRDKISHHPLEIVRVKFFLTCLEILALFPEVVLPFKVLEMSQRKLTFGKPIS